MEVAASLGLLGGSASSLDTCAARCEAPGPMATPNMLTAAAAGTEETARFDALGPIGAPKPVALSPIGAPKLMEESDDAGTLGAAVEAMVLVLVLVLVLLEVKVLLEVFSRSLQAPELIMLLGTRLIRRDALAGTLAASSRYSSPVCSFLSCSPKVVFPPSLISVMISLRRPTRMEELPSSSGTVVYVGSFLSLNRTDMGARAFLKTSREATPAGDGAGSNFLPLVAYYVGSNRREHMKNACAAARTSLPQEKKSF